MARSSNNSCPNVGGTPLFNELLDLYCFARVINEIVIWSSDPTWSANVGGRVTYQVWQAGQNKILPTFTKALQDLDLSCFQGASFATFKTAYTNVVAATNNFTSAVTALNNCSYGQDCPSFTSYQKAAITLSSSLITLQQAILTLVPPSVYGPIPLFTELLEFISYVSYLNTSLSIWSDPSLLSYTDCKAIREDIWLQHLVTLIEMNPLKKAVAKLQASLLTLPQPLQQDLKSLLTTVTTIIYFLRSNPSCASLQKILPPYVVIVAIQFLSVYQDFIALLPTTLPVVTAINPSAGGALGGTSVTITGINFTSASAVTFGAAPATAFSVNSSTNITAKAPPGNGSVNIIVTTPEGLSSKNAASLFAYQIAPYVTGITPKVGISTGKTLVTIIGDNFTGATAVFFGESSAESFTIQSNSRIIATSPPGLGTVHITVVTLGGTSPITPIDQFTYKELPLITAITPNSGPTSGGTLVTVTGKNFTATTAVTFGKTTAPFTLTSDTSLTTTAPPGSGAVDLFVTTPIGKSAPVPADTFTYYPVPTLIGVYPIRGPLSGGSVISITGTSLTGATAVNFGTNPATSFRVTSDGEITAIAPPGTGTVDITVTTPGGTTKITATDRFTYQKPPAISKVTPNTGPSRGGTSLVITGSDFTGATALTFGSNPAQSFLVTADSSILATAPSSNNTSGNATVDIQVTTLGGISSITPNDQFTYALEPTITTIIPTVGDTRGGTSVTITGTNFTNATSVRFGSLVATNYTVTSPTTITATSPPGSGVVDITVVTPGGTSPIVLSDRFTYQGAPTLTTLTPSGAPLKGGTSVQILGGNLSLVTGVNFGRAAASFTIESEREITAIAPPGSGSVAVTAIAPIGSSNSLPFTYYEVPVVKTIDPTQGTSGNLVTITGNYFTAASSIRFGKSLAQSFTVDSDTTIRAIAPSGTGTVTVVVFSPGGASSPTSAYFTYEPIPTITNIVPTAGPVRGGASVTIQGTNFINVTAVTFGQTSAQSFTVKSDSEVTAIAPSGVGTVDIRITTQAGISPISQADLFTYQEMPLVTSIDPKEGSTSGSTVVTITGNNFINVESVNFGAALTTNFTLLSDTSLQAITPSGSGMVDITVVTAGGTSPITTNDQFTYLSQPTISSISPTSGPSTGNTLVTITGSGFTAATAVNFGPIPSLMFKSLSDTTIQATAPPGSGIVDITIVTPGGSSSKTGADLYTYQGASPLPLVTEIDPLCGSTSGGTVVKIFGQNFTGATLVRFGSTAATTFTVNSNTLITATAPQGTSVVDVTVTTASGTSPITVKDQFVYQDKAPVITSLSPSSGSRFGGTSVCIKGVNFSNLTGVTFGGLNAQDKSFISDTLIKATSSNQAAGTIDVTVTTAQGSSLPSSYSKFTFETPRRITSLSPTFGLETGGTSITIYGENFTAITTVYIGKTSVQFTVASDAKSITAITPPGTGSVEITLVTSDGTPIVSETPFTYQTVSLTPSLLSIAPKYGDPTGGTPIRITGSRFTGTTAVYFGTESASFTVDSDISLTATSPKNVSSSDTVDITVVTPQGRSVTSFETKFVYCRVPTNSTLMLLVNDSKTLTDDEVYVLVKGSIPQTKEGIYLNITNGDGSLVKVTPTSQSKDYSYKLSALPGITNYRHISIPLVDSARIYFSLKDYLDLSVEEVSGQYQVIDPDALNPTNDNYFILYDKLELAVVDDPAASNISINTTAVDFFSLPISLSPTVGFTAYKTVGLPYKRTDIFSKVKKTITINDVTPTHEWLKLFVKDSVDPKNDLRILSTGKAMSGENPIFTNTYLANDQFGFNWIANVWSNFYLNNGANSLSVDTQEIKSCSYSGEVDPTTHDFVFSNGNDEQRLKLPYLPENPTQPDSTPFFAGGTSTFDGGGALAIIVRDLTSAFVAGLLPENVPLETPLNIDFFLKQLYLNKYYKANGNLGPTGASTGPWYDLYSLALHTIGGSSPFFDLIYTFAYDDQLNIGGKFDSGRTTDPISCTLKLHDLTGTTIPDPYTDTTTYTVFFTVGCCNRVIYNGTTYEGGPVGRSFAATPFQVVGKLENIVILDNDRNPYTTNLYIKYKLRRPAAKNAGGIDFNPVPGTAMIEIAIPGMKSCPGAGGSCP